MTSEELFYIPVSTEHFQNMQRLSSDIWDRYDDTYWYATEKKNYINSLENIWSNFMTIFNMFDVENQRALIEIISENLRDEIYKRLPKDYILNYL